MGSVTPWTVLDRAISFEDPRLRVHSDLCLTPQGEVVGPAHVIESPDQVAVVALTADGSKIVLVRRYCHGVGAVVTGLPSGVAEAAKGTPYLDVAEIAAHREHRKRARRAGMAALPAFQPRPESGTDNSVAAENAARRELLEQTGYAAAQWTCLLKSHLDSSHQTSAAYCFLATALDRAFFPSDPSADGMADIVEQDLVAALRLLQRGELAMDVLHAAALWSAASHIAADRTGRFGPLSSRLRRFLVGDDAAPGDEAASPAECLNAVVGG